MLGGLALKWRWRERMKAAGKPTDRPNLVTGVNVQVCWEKFCRYWDVEPRLVPMEGDRLHLGAEEAAALCDENTIGVVTVLGSTFDGSYEPVVVEDLPAHLIDDPAGQRFKHLSLISSLRPGAAMPLTSVTLPARVLASADMMDTAGAAAARRGTRWGKPVSNTLREDIR